MTDRSGDLEEPSAGLERAEMLARTMRPPGWSQLAQDVKAGARRVVRPDRTVVAEVKADGSRTMVSTRALVALLGGALRLSPQYAPADLTFRVDADRVSAVEVSLVAAFGADLASVSADVRRCVVAGAGSILAGPGVPTAALVVDVDVVDVVDGDPRTV